MLVPPLLFGLFLVALAVAAVGIFVPDLTLLRDLGFLVALLSLGAGLALGPEPQRRKEEPRPRSAAAAPAAPAAQPAPPREAPAPAPKPSPPPVTEPVTAQAAGHDQEPPAGYTRGMCSQCGTALTLSTRRPIRAKCPNCGHTKLLE